MDQAAAQVYQSVIVLAQATARDVAEHLGLSTAEVTDCLDHLHSRGVIQPSQVVPGGWRAVNPAAAMGPLIAEQERRLARQFEEVAHTREVLDRLGDLYRQSERRREAVVRMADRDDVLTHVSDLVSIVRDEVAAFVTNKPSTAALEQSRALDADLLSRGVRLRTLCLDTFRRDRIMQKALKESAAAGVEIRTLPILPTRMIVFDRRSAVIATDPSDPSQGALLVSDHAAVSLLLDLFEHYWSDGAPLAEEAGAASDDIELTAMEQMVLRMLADGNKDEAIARSTGQSVRTVRRIVSGLSAKVGAKGRFDLALHASDRGWVSRPTQLVGSRDPAESA